MKTKTLTAQTDFQAVYEKGLKQVSKSFVLFWLPAERDFKYAVVASRKTIGIAVKRNRAKRILRELLKEAIALPAPTEEATTLRELCDSNISASCGTEGTLDVRLKGSLILVARAELLNGRFDNLKTELKKCLKNWQLV